MSSVSDDIDLNPNDFHFIPLGGSEQFGVNFNLYAFQGKWLGIDLGIGFADHRFPGIDLLLPDPSFMSERRDDLEGLIITHAHEDHIGAVSHLWPRLGCPVYCTPFTASVLRRKIDEVPESRMMDIHEVSPGDTIDIGPFKVHFIHVAHSIPQSVSVALETPDGYVIHSGDWNLDPTPVLGEPTDKGSFQELSKKGVLAYIGTRQMRASADARVRKRL